MRDPKFVVIGGGTGIASILRGLKRFSEEISAIVTMADDGGSSGKLRRELGMLPPGDVRNCLVALANTEPSLEKLLQYRFKEGDLKDQNMGNLIITALTDLYGGFAEGVGEAASVLKITGKVLPVTTESIQLIGKFSDGARIIGESAIPDYTKAKGTAITSISLSPASPLANPDCLLAIKEADMIIIGPGSLYTSLIPNLLVPEIARAIDEATSPLVYIANIMEQRGETEGMSMCEHMEALVRHGLNRKPNYLLLNDDVIDEETLQKYSQSEGVNPIIVSKEEERRLLREGTYVERGAFHIEEDGLIRHDGLMVAQRLLSLCDRYHEIHCKDKGSAL